LSGESPRARASEKEPAADPRAEVPRAGGEGRLSAKNLIPLAVFALGLGVFFLAGLNRYLTLEALREHHGLLEEWVRNAGSAGVLAYIAIYAAAIAFSVPGGAVMSITGGFLFGSLWGTLYILIGATLGATILFSAAKTSLGDPLRARAGPWMRRMEAGFRENALSYLLVLRLVPLFPFFVVNLVPAFLGVPLSTYVVGTFVGIIPGAFVFASVGAGLGSVLKAGREFRLEGIFTPQILTALVGLAVLVLIPVAYKKLRGPRT